MCFFELQTTAKDYAKQSHEYFQLLCRLVLLISIFMDKYPPQCNVLNLYLLQNCNKLCICIFHFRLLNYACASQATLPTAEVLLNNEISWLKRVKVSTVNCGKQPFQLFKC